MTVKYPQVRYALPATVDEDGNAFLVVAGVRIALRAAGIDEDDIQVFTRRCFAVSTYEALVEVVRETVTIA